MCARPSAVVLVLRRIVSDDSRVVPWHRGIFVTIIVIDMCIFTVTRQSVRSCHMVINSNLSLSSLQNNR